MTPEVTGVITTIVAAGAAGGAVGAAKLGVQTLLKSYDYLRHEMGMTPRQAMREAREQAEREHAQSEMFQRRKPGGR